MPHLDVQRLVRIRKGRGRGGVLLLVGRPARETHRLGAQVHRRQGPANHRVQAARLQGRRVVRRHQPERHRSSLLRHARQRGHLRRATSETAQHGAHRAGVRRLGGQLLRRPGRLAARVRRSRLRSQPRRGELHVHRRGPAPAVVHDPHQGPQQAHDRADQGRDARRAARRRGSPRRRLRHPRRRRLRDRRRDGARPRPQAQRLGQKEVRHPSLRRRAPHHPQGPRRELGLRRAGDHRQAPRRARAVQDVGRARPPNRRRDRSRGARRVRWVSHQEAVPAPRDRPRDAVAPRRRGHQSRQEDGPGPRPGRTGRIRRR
mmetsp:Transcript_22073/g.87596  ORF Transcript_22073/g.87596 Transcript_22073/m.87596 type:complete len:317 (-) Transcript_22073:361-1311(-)